MKTGFKMRYLTLSILLFSLSLCADERNTSGGFHIAVAGGMGLSSISPTDIVNYINAGFVADPADRLNEFNNSIEFFISCDVFIRQNISVGVEYGYLINSHAVASPVGSFQFGYTIHLPIILMQYVLYGEGWHIKIGGGVGYTHAIFSEKFPYDEQFRSFTGNGVGGKILCSVHTPFSESLFGFVGVDTRVGLVPRLKNNEGELLERLNHSINMNFISFGLKFGIIHYF